MMGGEYSCYFVSPSNIAYDDASLIVVVEPVGKTPRPDLALVLFGRELTAHGCVVDRVVDGVRRRRAHKHTIILSISRANSFQPFRKRRRHSLVRCKRKLFVRARSLYVHYGEVINSTKWNHSKLIMTLLSIKD